jgi:hypothetical protein
MPLHTAAKIATAKERANNANAGELLPFRLKKLVVPVALILL